MICMMCWTVKGLSNVWRDTWEKSKADSIQDLQWLQPYSWRAIKTESLRSPKQHDFTQRCYRCKIAATYPSFITENPHVSLNDLLLLSWAFRCQQNLADFFLTSPNMVQHCCIVQCLVFFHSDLWRISVCFATKGATLTLGSAEVQLEIRCLQRLLFESVSSSRHRPLDGCFWGSVSLSLYPGIHLGDLSVTRPFLYPLSYHCHSVHPVQTLFHRVWWLPFSQQSKRGWKCSLA